MLMVLWIFKIIFVIEFDGLKLFATWHSSEKLNNDQLRYLFLEIMQWEKRTFSLLLKIVLLQTRTISLSEMLRIDVARGYCFTMFFTGQIGWKPHCLFLDTHTHTHTHTHSKEKTWINVDILSISYFTDLGVRLNDAVWW